MFHAPEYVFFFPEGNFPHIGIFSSRFPFPQPEFSTHAVDVSNNILLTREGIIRRM
jgi:hypothetical protein